MEEKTPLILCSKSTYRTNECGKSANEEFRRPEATSLKNALSFVDSHEFRCVAFGTLASIIHGLSFPIMSVFVGGMTLVFLRVQRYSDMNATNTDENFNLLPISREEFNSQIALYCLYYILLGLVTLASSCIQISCWETFAELFICKIREKYLRAILRQEIQWFESQQSGNLTTRLTDDIERVREGIGDKVSLLLQNLSTSFAGFIIGFVVSWKITLVMITFAPLTVLTGAWMGRVVASRTQIEQEKYAVAGAIAEETFSNVRTVLSLNGTKQEIRRYEAALEIGRKVGLVKYLYMGIGLGLMEFTVFASYAIALWFGVSLVIRDPLLDRGALFTVLFAVTSASTALGHALPQWTSCSMAYGAARKVFEIINMVPVIDPYSVQGSSSLNPKGVLSFENVSFSYPSRKDLKAISGVSFRLQSGRKIALVGHSGSGKSTIISLLLRFYDPTEGNIYLDNIDLKLLNVSKLRDAIGLVFQEPILFDGTIEENMRLGNDEITCREMITACEQANAWQFIKSLPNRLQTRVGERGVQLSGGQKQRIAIARAIVKNPLILLLDEATSALDSESEIAVQKALEQAQHNRTTIIIAHRLSTVQNADEILVLKDGSIIANGSHTELLSHSSVYRDMVSTQSIILDDCCIINEITDTEESSVRFARNRKVSSISTQSDFDTHTSELGSQSSVVHVKKLLEAVDRNSLKKTSLLKIILVNRESWPYLFLGTLGSCMTGAATPLFSFAYSKIFDVMSKPTDQMASLAIIWSLMFVFSGLIAAFGFLISANALGMCGETLSKKLRLMAFTNILRQDIRFYDDASHGTGMLCTRLATDVPNVRYVFTRLPVLLSAAISLAGGIFIGFIFGWQLAIVLLTIIPFIIGSGYFQMNMTFGKLLRDTKLLEHAGKVSVEAIENVRTVQALNKQEFFINEYHRSLSAPLKVNLKQTRVYGAVYAFSQSLIFFMYALSFWIGSIFVNNRTMTPVDVYRVFFAFAICGQSAGQISSFIPDIIKARLAATLIFHLCEHPSQIDSLSDDGLKSCIKGNIQLKNIHFRYPTRLQIPVLRGLTFNIKSGSTVALVGYSGSGKSTVMSLLERFYRLDRGSILIDEKDINDYNIRSLRNMICIVSQEPTLFNGSIEENVKYGLEGYTTHDDVMSACKLANIHDFIMLLPKAYQTRIGEKGANLSGGQKQRIAIARALIRNPPILLLDEATSALDTLNEKAVQSAINSAQNGRTCLIIAHRLSTIQNCDLIIVMNEGKVAQKGRHFQLLEEGGIYKTLIDSQVLNQNQ